MPANLEGEEHDDVPTLRSWSPGVDGGEAFADPLEPKDGDVEEIMQAVHARARERLFSRGPAHRIGRFVLLSQLGHGGMGTVHAAYDERLDRKVAVKVLLDEEIPHVSSRKRFEREALALARLSHPNVVTVYEVGEDDGRLFLAMEFVHGQSFDKWFRTKPTLGAVIDAFVQAGGGLAAAHRAGLVHRDLKPQNIMRGEHGEVKVVDFGLARLGERSADASGADYAMEGRSPMDYELSLTFPGMLLGTPAYMSPEQSRGERCDALSDQYSFCVTLLEGLYGGRPEIGMSESALIEWIERKTRTRSTQIPREVRDALIRGLAVDRSERWPSMEALLERLRRRPVHRRRRVWVALGGVSLVAAIAFSLDRASSTDFDPCADAAGLLQRTWNDVRRAQVEAAIVDVDAPYATTMARRAERLLDDYADEWSSMRTEACRATLVRKEQSVELHERQRVCLDLAATELGSTVEMLADPDEAVVANADRLIAALPPIWRCGDVEVLMTEVERPASDEVSAVLDARAELARARRLLDVGQSKAAREVVDIARSKASRLAYEPIRAHIALLRGRVLTELGDYDEAESMLHEALAFGLRLRQRDLMRRAANQRMSLVGYLRRKPAQALNEAWLAEGLSEGRPEYEADFYRHHALVLVQNEEFDTAEGELREAISILREVHGPEHPAISSGFNELGNVLLHSGRYEEAAQEYRRALGLRLEHLGPEHPRSGELHLNLAKALYRLERYEDAKAEIEAALSLTGPSDPRRGPLLFFRARISKSLGDYRAAESSYRETLAFQLRMLGPIHLDIAELHDDLASLFREQGRLDEAVTELRLEISILDKVAGLNQPALVQARMRLVSLLEEMDAVPEALAVAERTWRSLQQENLSDALRGQVTFTLAKLLWDARGPTRDRERAQRLAERALRVLDTEAPESNEVVGEIRSWLDANVGG